MNDRHEKRIETVLATLRDADPAAGMETRLLAALHRAAESHAQEKNHWQLTAWGLSWKMSAAAAVVLAAAVGAALYPHAKAHQGPSHEAVPQGRSSPGRALAHQASARRTPAPENALRTSGSRRTKQSPVQFLHANGQTADRGSHTGNESSFPAPPLPLTEQERLLLRLVHHEPSRQLAQLTSATLNAGIQHEKDAFDEFFAPRAPLPGQQEPPPYVPQAGQP